MTPQDPLLSTPEEIEAGQRELRPPLGSGRKPGGILHLPLYMHILIAVALATIVGLSLGQRVAFLEDWGKLLIGLLKALATPLIFLAVVDALLRAEIVPRQGFKLICISAVNAIVATVIGLTIANMLHQGTRWQGHLSEVKHQLAIGEDVEKRLVSTKASLRVIDNVSQFVPQSMVSPFAENNVIPVVILAIFLGVALRKLRTKLKTPREIQHFEFVDGATNIMFRGFSQILEGVVRVIPLAVFAVVAALIGRSGVHVFAMLGVFVLTILLGMIIHAVFYYSLLLTLAGKSPLKFFRGAFDSIITAMSCGSSLATLPVTLRCLNDKLKVSPGNARLAACVGTNLNHDGIILYEAAATIFVAQALGYHLGLGQQVAIGLASIMAGVGIAGVPDAGWITLPLVLTTAGLPAAQVASVVAVLLPVDWIIGRCRATVNVISDMTVATLLDRLGGAEESPLAKR